MAYEFKKLSEMELLDSVPENATVLAEVDGVIRRVPGDGLGGGGTAKEVVFAEQTLEFVEDDGVCLWFAEGVVFSFTEGEMYQVLWGEDTYTLTARGFSDGEISLTYLGNAGYQGVANTGEPFLFQSVPPEIAGNETGQSMIMTIDGVVNTEGNVTPRTVAIYRVGPFSAQALASFFSHDGQNLYLTSTSGDKCFKITVDDTGAITASEIMT